MGIGGENKIKQWREERNHIRAESGPRKARPEVD